MTARLAAAALIAAAVLAAAPAPALGQEPRFVPNLTDDVVRRLAQRARDNLKYARLPSGAPVPVETDAEKRVSIMPLQDQRRVVDAGYVSAYAEWCGMDWRGLNYTRLMEFERRRGIWSDKQIVYARLLHDLSQADGLRSLRPAGRCPPAQREQVASFLRGRWR